MGWFQKIVYGVDLEAEQKRSDELDRRIAIENEKDYSPGGSVYNQIAVRDGVEAANDTYAEVQERQSESHIDVEAEVDSAFDEGWDEGAANIRGTIAAPFKLTWSIIPWQLLVLGLVMLFFYMGGHLWLKGIIKRLGK